MKRDYPENVIVTVRCRRPRLEEDVRLSTDRAMQSWLPELVTLLNQHCGTNFSAQYLEVTYNGRKVIGQQTLASLGAWDGSVLYLKGGQI